MTETDTWRKLCSGPELTRLLELVKSGDDLLDLFSPYENQHSDILAWCFNAKEGHGQGDAIFKDFLLAAVNAEKTITGHGLGRDFIKQWTPERILTTSFATNICYREYSVKTDRQGGQSAGPSNRKVDLLAIDPDNKIIVVIENKYGSPHTKAQLEGYVQGIQHKLLKRAAFNGFLALFVALDINYIDDGEDLADENFDTRWARLNYDWLKPAGQRAEIALDHGNNNVSILLSYCRRQTGWESAETKMISKLAQDIAVRYPSVIKELSQFAGKFKMPESWTTKHLDPSDIKGQQIKLYLQNKNAMDWLLDLPPLKLLHALLAEHFPTLNESPDVYEHGRVWMAYQLPLQQLIPRVGVEWPLYLYVRHKNPDDSVSPIFRIRIVWRPFFVHEAESDDIAILSNKIASIYPSAKGTQGRQKAITLFSATYRGIKESEKVILEIFKQIEQMFK